MIPLIDSRWKEFEGGYRIPYDASAPLKRLEQATTDVEVNAVFSELWDELHHQGDVGLASYLSVPHLIRIAKERNLYDWNVFGLVTIIEIQRHKNNPKLPVEYEDSYLKSIQKELPDLVKEVINNNWDVTMASTILSALAVSKGHIELADAILKMEGESLVKEFLENY